MVIRRDSSRMEEAHTHMQARRCLAVIRGRVCIRDTPSAQAAPNHCSLKPQSIALIICFCLMTLLGTREGEQRAALPLAGNIRSGNFLIIFIKYVIIV